LILIKMSRAKLSIIVLSYNTKDLLRDCLNSLKKRKSEVDLEVIVPDNGSNDGSIKMVKKDFPKMQLIENGKNLGFAAGNNVARKYCQGEYILFLNSDTIVNRGTLKESVKYLKNNPKVAAMTCKILLPDGRLDKDARRSFPTPWVALTHMVLRLDRFFPKSPLFSKYWYGYLPEDEIHEVDVLQGAFFLARKKVLDKVGWFDEDYFLDGEDIDLCWKIKSLGWKIIYYPKVSIIHFKGASKGKIKKMRKKIPLKNRIRFKMAGVNSMEIFYRKRLRDEYPFALNLLVLLSIRTLKLIRVSKLILFG